MRFTGLTPLLVAYFVIVLHSLQKLCFESEAFKHQLQTIFKILEPLWFRFELLLAGAFCWIEWIVLKELALGVSAHRIFDLAIFLAVDVEFSWCFG